MASVYYLHDCGLSIDEEIVGEYGAYFYTDKLRYFCAVKIQRVWRGYKVRKEIERWNKAAELIQRIARGWLLRWKLPGLLKAYYDMKIMKYYNDQAVIIQTAFRGYLVRKVIDFRKIRSELQMIKAINDRMKQMLLEVLAQMRKDNSDEMTYLQKVCVTLFHKHHLMRTRQREGVLSLHDSEQLSDIETVMKQFRYKDYMKGIRRSYKKHQTCGDKVPTPDGKKSGMIGDMLLDSTYQEDLVVRQKPSKSNFVLTPKIPEEPFMPTVYPVGPSQDNVLSRTTDNSKHMSEKDFDLYVHKKDDKPFKPVYNPNFWWAQCQVHKKL